MKGQFKLCINETAVDYNGPEKVEIAKIVDSTAKKDAMYIVYERDLWKRWGYHTCIEEYERDGEDYPVAVIDDLHRPCLYDHPEIFLTIMLHELGHYRNGDLFAFDEEEVSNEKIKDIRADAILHGKVQMQELRADAFAVQHVGKNTFMRTMDYMINKRRQRSDTGMELAIKEFELRKKAIQNMK